MLTFVQLDIFLARLVADLATLMAYGQAKRVLRSSRGGDIKRYGACRSHARAHCGPEDDLATPTY